MKIVVLNGSPKGNLSTTLQYVRFMEKKFPGNSLQVFNIAHDIRKIETDETIFRGIIDGMKDADCILWAFPIYYFLVAAQYKRFIELIWERGVRLPSKTSTPLPSQHPFIYLTTWPTITFMQSAMTLK